MKAFIFPGQASQFAGMGKDLYESSSLARERFAYADKLVGFDLSKIMFDGSEDDLKQTSITQPAVFLHSVITAEINKNVLPSAVAGHSLGEFSALVSAQALTFEEGLRLVQIRATAMQKACEMNPGTMAAIVGLEDEVVENTCATVEGVVVAANYNCPGQLVISGEIGAVAEACSALKNLGAKRAIPLAVGGAFHSSLMSPAGSELAEAVNSATFSLPVCPVFQNVDANPSRDPVEIKEKLIQQLTAPVRWTSIIENMIDFGIQRFLEVGGTGKVLRGMVRRIDREIPTDAL